MSTSDPTSKTRPDTADAETSTKRSRPKPGERRLQILQTLAHLLEQSQGDRITTAALAQNLQLSEAALYRQFASKAQMYEGLIEFIESSLFSLINQIHAEHSSGSVQVLRTLEVMLRFAEHNPGMMRVIIGDALLSEHPRLLDRIQQLLGRIETSLKLSFRLAQQSGEIAPEPDAAIRADAALSLIIGRWHRYVRSGFQHRPSTLIPNLSQVL